jgi:glycosyltransferase involved in cell wall biosynthesis
MRIAIGLLVSHGFPAPSAFWDSYEQVMEHIRTGQTNSLLPAERAITGVRRIKSTAFPVDVARNEIVRDFLNGDEDYLFFMDADMTFPPSVVGRLLAHNTAVITARYHMRKIPYHAVLYVKHKTQEGPHCYAPVHYGKGLIEIERGGAGALLIRRDVLEVIQTRIGQNWFRYQRGPLPPHDFSVSEDFWFYQQAREAGYSIYADWDVECEHLQEFGINRSWNEAYLDAQVREFATMTPEAKQAALASLVVCGYPDGIRLASGDHLAPYQLSPGER